MCLVFLIMGLCNEFDSNVIPVKEWGLNYMVMLGIMSANVVEFRIFLNNI